VWTDDVSQLQGAVCLVCGATASDEGGKSVGWHSWRSRMEPMRDQSRETLLRICPSCLVVPIFVANTIRRRHGLAHMVEWLRSRAALE
jgi:hypothetical protein